jgi:hypothetical protein
MTATNNWCGRAAIRDEQNWFRGLPKAATTNPICVWEIGSIWFVSMSFGDKRAGAMPWGNGVQS